VSRARRTGGAIAAAALATFVAVTLSSCAGSPAPTASGSTASARPSSPVATPSASEAPPAADPTCDTIIPQTTVSSLEDAGWSSQQDPFYIGNTEIPDGLQCTWGDTTVASDHVQIYGWAPITADQADAAKKDLLGQGWREVDVDGAVYITAGKDMIMDPDDDGYGMTYRFGDGWVTVADTKQGLVLVEWPPKG
jgi:hypothetical protein